MNVGVGFISVFLRSGSRLRRRPSPHSGERSWARQSGSAGRASSPPSLVGPVELERHRSDGTAAARAPVVKAPRRRRPHRRERRPGPSPPSSQSSISWVNDTSLENSAPTDSPRWMRLIASPMSGATDSTVILGMRLAGRAAAPSR